MEACTPLKKCRVCLGDRLDAFLSLGMMPPINNFLPNLESAKEERFYPLEVAICGSCSHIQLTHAINPEVSFSDYVYFSSMSDAFVAHGKELAVLAKELTNLADNDLAVEVASNDGAMLQSFQALPARVLGIEPAQNIVKAANERGIPTVPRFFNRELARAIKDEHGAAKIILGTNVLAHVLDLRDFVSGMSELLASDGIVMIEVPYLADLLQKLEFDTIYHEHLSYFRVEVLDNLFANCGLRIFDVRHIPIHGGSLLVLAEGSEGTRQRTGRVDAFIKSEREAGLHTTAPYKQFAQKTSELRGKIFSFLEQIKKSGKTIAAYGAAAKGNVLANYCGIGPETVSFVADKSPYKQGKLTPGSHIPVVAPSKLLEARPDVCIIMAWNFKEEIMRQMADYGKSGGKFAVLIPEPQIIN